MARANAVRGSPARITVRYEGEGHSTGTIRHPAADDSAAAAALRVPTKATSPAPADSSGATPPSSFRSEEHTPELQPPRSPLFPYTTLFRSTLPPTIRPPPPPCASPRRPHRPHRPIPAAPPRSVPSRRRLRRWRPATPPIPLLACH